jgi:hypothetical protein
MGFPICLDLVVEIFGDMSRCEVIDEAAENGLVV